MCRYDESKSYYRSHVGADSAYWLMMELKELADGIDAIMKKPKTMDPLTAEEERDFMDATCCHICEKPFQDGEERIKDHSHLTGKYRGPAQNSCNLNYQDSHVIPIIFHNLSGYDGHYLINDMANCFTGRIDLIPLNKEKYISFTKYIEGSTIKLRFIDSLRFMNSSLDKLAKDVKDLRIVRKKFSGVEPEKSELLCRKGI